ncbi:hypothetical protein CBS147353_11836 [Aspergillus niger]|nr:hypothetical protein CBS147353_11836 [Aspergillus niger]
MLLLDLPGELLLCVMDHLERAKDIHSLCLTNSQVYRQLLPALYRFNVRFENSSALHWAARYGKLELVQTICYYRARVNVYLLGYTPLHYAAMFGQAPVVRWLLSYDGIDVNCRGEGLGLTPLGVAVRREDVEVVQVLLSDARTDINAGSRDNKTPLLDAIKHRHLVILRLLLADARIEMHPQGQSASPLMYAMRKDFGCGGRALLAHGDIDVSARDLKDRTVLHYAVLHNDDGLVQLLLQKQDLDVNAQDLLGMTALHRAIIKDNRRIVALLLTRSDLDVSLCGADGHWKIYEEMPPLCLAVALRRNRICQLLLEASTDADVRTASGNSPLHLAAGMADLDLLTLLLNQPDIKLNGRNDDGFTALHEATTRGYLSVAKLLLAAPGVDANVGDTCGRTALWWATKRSDENLTKRLLCEDDLDLNVVGRDGSTSLHHAIQYRNRTIARLLLCEERLDINIPDMTGWTPLVWAVHQADINMVRLLLARDDLQLDPIFAGNASALGLAAERGHTKIVNLFLEHGDCLDINLPTQTGETPLCRAAAAGHHDVVDLLLQDPQLDVNRVDLIGRSPLCWAVYAGHFNVVRRLLQDRRVVIKGDYFRRPALAAAHEMGHAEIADLLKAYRLG